MENNITKRIFLISFSLLFYHFCFGISTVYVSTSGNDSGNGTIVSPFLTLEKARDVLRAARSSGEKGPFSILLKGGDYYFAQTVKFEEQDKNLTIGPFNNEIVRFTGGISIDPSKAKPVAGSNKEKIFPKNNRGYILMINLKELGITDYGVLNEVGYEHAPFPSWMELFINGKAGHLSRWPNDSTIAIGKILDKGSVWPYEKSGIHGGKFTYPGNRPSNWKASHDIWIFGYFKLGCADDVVKLASIDTIGKIFTTVQPHFFGFSSETKWNTWFAYNIPEELDAPGEYYIDRDDGIVYFYNQGTIENINVSVLKDPFIVLKRAANIKIQGITFEYARGISLDMENSSECILKDCTIRNLGSYGVNISNTEGSGFPGQLCDTFISNSYGLNTCQAGKSDEGNNKCGLINCSIYDTGAGGIHLDGGDRKTLNPGENYVDNCTINNFNRIVQTYCAGVQISGVGNRIFHCEIFNAPHSAILLSGNDHLIEYNNIHDVVLLTDDAGALYYWNDPSMRGHMVRYNYFHDIGTRGRTSAVYQDNGVCGMTVWGNIFYRAGTIPVKIGGGSDNTYTNNIFIDCVTAIHIDNRLEQDWAKHLIQPGNVFEKELNDIHYNNPPYSKRYANLARYWQDNPSIPKRNQIDKNLFIRVDKVIVGELKYLEYSDNNYITAKDPGFENEKKRNFKLKLTSDVFKKIPGFQQIPIEKIGRNK